MCIKVQTEEQKSKMKILEIGLEEENRRKHNCLAQKEKMWITFCTDNTINWHINQREKYENRGRRGGRHIKSKTINKN